MSLRSLGGVRVKHTLPSVDVTAPAPALSCSLFSIPLNMHIGAPAVPCVEAGDHVDKGQKIAEARGAISAFIHSPVSGTVKAVEPRLSARGTMVPSVIIESDGLDTLASTVVPHPECENDPDAFTALVRECGIVGMGGATFPTAAKIDSARGKVDTVIINGAECEPGIVSDYRSMLEESASLLHGIKLLMMACGAPSAILAIEDNKEKAISLLSPLLPPEIRIHVLPGIYPQGGEKQLIYNTLGREIPSGGLPANVGCAVFNVETTIACAKAVETGLPLIERYCTVSGPAVKHPWAGMVRVGTPVSALLEAAGAYARTPKKLVLGGLMMGSAIYDTDIPVGKGSNAILALSEDDTRREQESSCIRCGKCIEHCPMGLMPNYLYMFVRKNNMEALQEYHLADCLDCGSCAYGCPARLPLNHSFKLGKDKLRAWQNAQRAKAEQEAGK